MTLKALRLDFGASVPDRARAINEASELLCKAIPTTLSDYNRLTRLALHVTRVTVSCSDKAYREPDDLAAAMDVFNITARHILSEVERVAAADERYGATIASCLNKPSRPGDDW